MKKLVMATGAPSSTVNQQAAKSNNFPFQQPRKVIKQNSSSGTVGSRDKVRGHGASGGLFPKRKSDLLTDKLKNELVDLKYALSTECDDILNKIDDLLNTEVLTFDKALDYR